MHTKRRTRGVTLVEMLFAASLTAMTLLASMAVYLLGMSSWYQGQGRINAEIGSQDAVRIITQELRQAMAVTVSSDGKSLTYQVPLTDGTGEYAMPLAWDGVSRSIQLTGSNLTLTSGAKTRTICKNVIATDPTVSNAPYVVFKAGVGSVTRSVTVQVVTQWSSYKNGTVSSRSRETIFLRNVPN